MVLSNINRKILFLVVNKEKIDTEEKKHAISCLGAIFPPFKLGC